MQPPLKRRILLTITAFSVQAIYTPTSLFMQGGIEPKLYIDILPLQVGWVIPYVLCYPLWAFSIVWLLWRMEEKLFRATIAGLFFTFSLGILIYVLFPTYIVHPEIPGRDILSKLLLFLTLAGGDHDAFPSSHIYITVILALFYGDWYPRQKWLWYLMVMIITLSTLFTKQHYIADVVGGVIVGWLGHRFGLWWNTMAFKPMKSAHKSTE